MTISDKLLTQNDQVSKHPGKARHILCTFFFSVKVGS